MSSMQLRGALVVDDDKTMRELLANVLELEGCNPIYEAEDGADALDVLAENGSELDLVVLDYMMPGMDGEEVLRRLRSVYGGPLGVVMISGNHVLQKMIAGFRQPGLHVSYIYKPFQVEDFLSRVETVAKHLRDGR